MRICAFCGELCDSQIGMARELHTTFFGGKRAGVVYSPRVVAFFCSEQHRNDYIAAGGTSGEIQSKREERVLDD